MCHLELSQLKNDSFLKAVKNASDKLVLKGLRLSVYTSLLDPSALAKPILLGAMYTENPMLLCRHLLQSKVPISSSVGSATLHLAQTYVQSAMSRPASSWLAVVLG